MSVESSRSCHWQEIAARYGVLLKDKGVALRGLFIINPQGILEQSTINNLPIGRSVDEALRLLQAIQFTAEHGEVCPKYPCLCTPYSGVCAHLVRLQTMV